MIISLFIVLILSFILILANRNLIHVKNILGVFSILSAIFCFFPNFLTTITGKYSVNLGNGKVEAQYSSLTTILVSVMVNLAYFGMIIAFFAKLLRGDKIRLNPVLICLLAIWAYVSGLDLIYEKLHVANLGILLILSFICLSSPTSLNALCQQTFVFVELIIFCSAFVGVVYQEASWIPCRIDKCTVFGQLFRGIFPYANQAGLVVALAAPTAFFLFRNKTIKSIFATQVLFFVYLTGSRIALIGVAIGFIVAIFSSYLNARVLFLVSFCITFISLFPFSSNSLFTGRSFLWRIARQKIIGSPLGNGSSAWENSGYSVFLGSASSYSSHNLVLEILLTGGIPIFIIYLILVKEFYKKMVTDVSGIIISFFVTLSIIGIGERPFSFYYVDYSLPILLILIFLLNSSPKFSSLENKSKSD